jgi:hypothetical protein
VAVAQESPWETLSIRSMVQSCSLPTVLQLGQSVAANLFLFLKVILLPGTSLLHGWQSQAGSQSALSLNS